MKNYIIARPVRCNIKFRQCGKGGVEEIVPHDWGVLSEQSERRRGACPHSGSALYIKKLCDRALGSIFLLCFSFALSFAGEAIADSSSLDETIDALITLFDAKDYRAVVVQYSHPDAIVRMEIPDGDIEGAIHKLILLQERFGGMTLKRLKEAKDIRPHYFNDGQDALFDFGGGYFLRFRKDSSGKWCLL